MRRPGGDRAARTPRVGKSGSNTAQSRPSRCQKQTNDLRSDIRLHRATKRLHRLGPRPVSVLLLEVASGRDLIEALEEYAKFDAAAVARLGGRDWPPLPIRRVA
jgi:hypothetical protein